jgi:hypothetical protein
MLRKFGLIFVSIFISGPGQENTQIVVGQAWILLHLCLLVGCWPYKKGLRFNLLEVVSLLVVGLTLTLGKVEEESRGASDDGQIMSGISVLVVFLNIMVLVITIISTLLHFLSRQKQTVAVGNKIEALRRLVLTGKVMGTRGVSTIFKPQIETDAGVIRNEHDLSNNTMSTNAESSGIEMQATRALPGKTRMTQSMDSFKCDLQRHQDEAQRASVEDRGQTAARSRSNHDVDSVGGDSLYTSMERHENNALASSMSLWRAAGDRVRVAVRSLGNPEDKWSQATVQQEALALLARLDELIDGSDDPVPAVQALQAGGILDQGAGASLEEQTWIELQTEAGHRYYQSTASFETQWELPAGATLTNQVEDDLPRVPTIDVQQHECTGHCPGGSPKV